MVVRPASDPRTLQVASDLRLLPVPVPGHRFTVERAVAHRNPPVGRAVLRPELDGAGQLPAIVALLLYLDAVGDDPPGVSSITSPGEG